MRRCYLRMKAALGIACTAFAHSTAYNRPAGWAAVGAAGDQAVASPAAAVAAAAGEANALSPCPRHCRWGPADGRSNLLHPGTAALRTARLMVPAGACSCRTAAVAVVPQTYTLHNPPALACTLRQGPGTAAAAAGVGG